MNLPNISPLTRRLLVFLGQIIILLICIQYIQFFYTENILPDKLVAETFTVGNCNIVDKKLTEKGHVLHHYRADFLVSYLIDGVTYRSVASGNGLDYSFTTNEDTQTELLNEFDVGSEYPCWYNPTNPEVVVLVLRHSWSSTLPLIIPGVICVLMIYAIFKGFFQLLELYIANSRQKR